MLVGLTGGVATGKSTVATLFKEHGAVVFSADDAARAVTAPGSPTLQKIVERFGPEFLLPDGTLDRARLGANVFMNPSARQLLESLTHPAILALLREQIDSARAQSSDQAVIVVEVPLLYETGMESWFDRVVVVAASPAVQIARLRRRNGLTEQEAQRRIAAQSPLQDKIARADVVLWNEGDVQETARQVEALWREWTTDDRRPTTDGPTTDHRPPTTDHRPPNTEH